MIRRLIILLLIVGCAPITISNIQSAKMLEKGKFEFTPSVSTTFNTFNLGVQTAYGLNRKSNLRFRLERIFIDLCDRDDNCDNSFINYKLNLTHLSFGLKYPLKRNESAIYLPISFTKGDESTDILKLIEPTFIYSNGNEVTTSIKVLYPISSISITELKNALLAINIGFGLSNNYDKWIIRPELGLVTTLSFQGAVPIFSLGLSIYP